MALSAATVSSLFPASMRIRVVFRLPDIDALALLIFPLRGRLPEIALTVADVTIVGGHHLVAGDLDHGLLHDGAALVLNHGPVRIFTIQRDSEGQAGSPWNDHVVRAEVRESNQQLLILINRARVVCNHDRLPHSFDPQGLAEAPVRIKLASEFAQSHGVLEKKGKRKVQGVPQSQTAALPKPQEEEETDKSKQAQTEQTYEKH